MKTFYSTGQLSTTTELTYYGNKSKKFGSFTYNKLKHQSSSKIIFIDQEKSITEDFNAFQAEWIHFYYSEKYSHTEKSIGPFMLIAHI